MDYTQAEIVEVVFTLPPGAHFARGRPNGMAYEPVHV